MWANTPVELMLMNPFAPNVIGPIVKFSWAASWKFPADISIAPRPVALAKLRKLNVPDMAMTRYDPGER